MNYQRSTNKRVSLRSIIVCMLVLVALVACVAVSVYADGVTVKASDIVIGEDNVTTVNGIRYYTKVYDKTKDVVGRLTFAEDFDDTPFEEHPAVRIVIDKAELASDQAGETSLIVSFKLDGDANEVALYSNQIPTPVHIPAKITPMQLTWTEDLTVEASLPYSYKSNTYVVEKIGERTLAAFVRANLNGVLKGDELVIPEKLSVSVEADRPGTYTAPLVIDLGNYTATTLPVKVTVEKLAIKSVDFGKAEYFFGDESVFAIEATVTDETGKKWIVPVGYQQKNADGEWEVVDRISGAKAKYRIYIPAFSDLIDVPAWNAEEGADKITKEIEIVSKKYKVTMNDVTYVGDADLTTGENTTKFFATVVGIDENVPPEILKLIKYYDEDGNEFTGATAYGETMVTAKLPTSADYTFVNSSGKKITTLTAIITINHYYVSAGVEEGKTDVFVSSNGSGFASNVSAIVTAPEFDRNVLRGYPLHSEFTLKLENVDPEAVLALYIPHNEALYSKNVAALTVDDLYVFDSEKNELVKASEIFTVTLLDGAYKVEGYPASAEVTFVIAPAYTTPFFLTAPGIALIVMAIMAIAVILFFFGVKSRKAKATEQNETIVVDTVGDRYEGKITLVEGTDGAPRVDVDALTYEPEAEPEVEDDGVVAERTRDAVAASMQQLTDEAAQIVLPQEDLTVAEELTGALAQKLSDELDEKVGPDAEATAHDVSEDELNAAVAEAMQVVTNESADATDAVEVIVEPAVEAMAQAEADDDDDDDDDDDALGFSTAGLTFIDVSAEPEAYNEMLEQERAGLIKIVYRYRRSFVSRVSQSQGSIQDYYNEIKNLLLSYKGVKGRISWNYEAFNRGRTHLAKINAKTKTLYLYLALNPEELVDSKYGIVDMSSKKKYASVPVLMKIKGERKFKYALELIEKLCGEDQALPKLESYEAADFRIPYQTTEALVADGAMKMYAAAISMTDNTEG